MSIEFQFKSNSNNFKSMSTKYQQKNKMQAKEIYIRTSQSSVPMHTHTHTHTHTHIHAHTHAHTCARAPGIVPKLTNSVLQPVTLIPAHRALAAPSLLNTLNWTNPATNSPGKQEAEKVLSI